MYQSWHHYFSVKPSQILLTRFTHFASLGFVKDIITPEILDTAVTIDIEEKQARLSSRAFLLRSASTPKYQAKYLSSKTLTH
jgi:hypothetical protein